MGEIMKEISNFINSYNVYQGLSIDDEYFEDKFLEYFYKFKNELQEMIRDNNLTELETKRVWKIFYEKVSSSNDMMISIILNKDIDYMKIYIRKIKDVILASEEGNKTREHLKKIDLMVDKLSDYNISTDEENIMKIFDMFNPSYDSYFDDVIKLKKIVNDIVDNYRRNYSLKIANKKIRLLEDRVNKIIDDKAFSLGIVTSDYNKFLAMINDYKNKEIKNVDEYRELVRELRKWYNDFKDEINKKYSCSLASKLNDKYSSLIDKIISRFNKRINYNEEVSLKLEEIFKLHLWNILRIDEEFKKCNYWWQYTNDEIYNKKRVLYEEKVRQYKKNIRTLTKDIREFYSSKEAQRLVARINLIADKYNNKLAKDMGMPVPKNPWMIRKYLWADLDNFNSEYGNEIRKIINKPWRFIVRSLAVNNKIVVEEEQNLDLSRPYIFVSTHYFTEDVIGLFSSINRQAYMLMGTTDQIENNPLMLAAILFGFFHVDRMDPESRTLCFEKQNALISQGASFINYVGGSWENSENELQPLSFSGPVKTSKLTGALIVPVSSYLVPEDKTIYMRFGNPLDVRKMEIDCANEMIRDTLATMHYKQLEKYSYPIKDTIIYDKDREIRTHDLPYNQHIYYMNQVGNEYWNQPWTKPFAKEEIGLRKRHVTSIDEVYSFIDNLSRENLINSAFELAPIMSKIDEHERYDIVKYLDENYDKFKVRSRKNKD